MGRRLEHGRADRTPARAWCRSDHGIGMVLRRSMDIGGGRVFERDEGEACGARRQGLHGRSVLSLVDEQFRRQVRTVFRKERQRGGTSPRLLPRQLRILRRDAKEGGRSVFDAARGVPCVVRLVPVERVSDPQRGARRPRELARPLCPCRHARDRDVRARMPGHSRL